MNFSASDPNKQTIVLVHGTFSAPRNDLHQWWQVDVAGSFVPKLEKALQRRGLEIRCWAHCESSSHFHWTGENDWVARISASSALAQQIAELAANGWRCHLVGHSHGGNVIAETLTTLAGTPQEQSIASVTTLGTPFLDALDAIDRHKRKQRQLSATFMAIGAAFALFTTGTVLYSASPDVGWEMYTVVGLLLAAIAMGAWGFLGQAFAQRKRRKRQAAKPVPGLALNSQYDEAWQLLHHVRQTKDPLAVGEGLIAYLRRQMRAAVFRRRAVYAALSFAPTSDGGPRAWLKSLFRIFYAISLAVMVTPIVRQGLSMGNVVIGLLAGLISFISFGAIIFAFGFGAWRQTQMYFTPLATATLWVQSLGVIPSEIITYVVRARSWALLQRWTLGLHGYNFDLPVIKTTPASAGAARFTFEALPPEVEQRALQSRSLWLERQLGSATEFFSQLVLSAADAADLLQQIECDPSLVHAAYYTDDVCIERIAEWIGAHAVPAAILPCRSPGRDV